MSDVLAAWVALVHDTPPVLLGAALAVAALLPLVVGLAVALYLAERRS